MLTPEQRLLRKGRITASRIAVLMNGDQDGIMRLYREFIGELEEDTYMSFQMRLGSLTESLNLDWYEEQQRRPVRNRGAVIVSKDKPWAACTLDGWDSELSCPIECKHVNGFEPIEIIINRYQPQMQWQMFVTGAQECALSCIMGNRPPVVDYIKRADAYIYLAIRRADYFMQCVALEREPVMIQVAVDPPMDPDAIINMVGNNAWATNALTFIQTKQASKDFESAKETLKELMPDKAKVCFGHGVRVTRTRGGSLYVKVDKEEEL